MPLDAAAIDLLFREARSHNRFNDQPVTDYPGVLASDRAKGRRFGLECVDRGLWLNPGEKFYVSLAHDTEDVEKTLDIFADALDAM